MGGSDHDVRGRSGDVRPAQPLVPPRPASADPDPTRPSAAGAVAHLNEDHADVLLAAARAFGGHPDATSARAERVDRYGIDLVVATPRGPAMTRVGFAEPVGGGGPDGLRVACVDLARRARAALAGEGQARR